MTHLLACTDLCMKAQVPVSMLAEVGQVATRNLGICIDQIAGLSPSSVLSFQIWLKGVC